jgi:hypothetical protein
MATPEWKSLIEAAVKARPEPIAAQTYVKEWGSRSKPALLRCSNQKDYVVKGSQRGKDLIAEEVVAGLGLLIGAPLPEMLLVDVADDLIQQQRKASPAGLQHMQAGIGHGCLYVGDVDQAPGPIHVDVEENKLRFARLAVLYGWVSPADVQLHYEVAKPPLVWSVDHEGFNLLRADRGCPFQMFVTQAKLSAEDLLAVKPALEGIAPEGIAGAAARPHESWSITLDERVRLAQHLDQKRQELIASLT